MTVHVYVRPVVTPATVIGVEAAPGLTADCVTPPSVDVHVAVNCVTTDPWFEAGLCATVRVPVADVVAPEAAAIFLGAAGAPTITAALGADAGPTPDADVLETVNV